MMLEITLMMVMNMMVEKDMRRMWQPPRHASPAYSAVRPGSVRSGCGSRRTSCREGRTYSCSCYLRCQFNCHCHDLLMINNTIINIRIVIMIFIDMIRLFLTRLGDCVRVWLSPANPTIVMGVIIFFVIFSFYILFQPSLWLSWGRLGIALRRLWWAGTDCWCIACVLIQACWRPEVWVFDLDD